MIGEKYKVIFHKKNKSENEMMKSYQIRFIIN